MTKILNMSNATTQNFVEFVTRYLIVNDAKCNRHCQNPAKFVTIKTDGPNFVGGYFCPGNYATRVVYFSPKPDRQWFENLLKEQAGGLFRAKDIRHATRHGWELGGGAEAEIAKISDGEVRQYYWTFYPANEEEKTTGAFRCEKCGSLFVKKYSDDSTLCRNCRSTS
jgi:hypothetical protein